MPNFLEKIFDQLERSAGRVVLREIRGEHFVSFTGRELLDQIQLIRAYLRSCALQPGDRCALLGPNSVRWIAINLALMAEGLIVVPLYSRQAPAELAAMLKDCQPGLLFVSDVAMGESVAHSWPGNPENAPRRVLFEEVLRVPPFHLELPDAPNPRSDAG